MKNKDLQIEESQLKEALKDEYKQLVNDVCSEPGMRALPSIDVCQVAAI